MLQLCTSCIGDCFRRIVAVARRKLGIKNKYDGIEEYEEEEFSFPFIVVKAHHDEHQATQKSTKVDLQGKDHQNNRTQVQFQINKHRFSKQHRINRFVPPNYDFKINLQLYNEYYHLIEEKTRNLRDIFEGEGEQMLVRFEKSKIEIDEIPTINGHKIILRYSLPCSYAFYNTIKRDNAVLMKCTQRIDYHKLVQTIYNNLTVYETSFRKFMLLQPRLFRYIKYQNSSNNNKNESLHTNEIEHWQICISINPKQKQQIPLNLNNHSAKDAPKQCQLLSVTCLVENNNQLNVITYLQLDLKSNIKAPKIVLRAYQQVADYIDALYTHIFLNYQRQFV